MNIQRLRHLHSNNQAQQISYQLTAIFQNQELTWIKVYSSQTSELMRNNVATKISKNFLIIVELKK
jgi:hypothetical protein